MKKKKQLSQSIGVFFIRWNLYNRVAVAVAYFEEGEMVFMKVDKKKMQKLCDNFIPVSFFFISKTPLAMQKQKTNSDIWNKQSDQQNGILEIKKASPIAIKLNRRDFNKFAKIYLK